MTKIKQLLDTIQTENKICILLGDLNIDLLKPNNESEELISVFNSRFYFNSITKPTRVKPKSATLIDHIWSNTLGNLESSAIIYINLSDHFPVVSKFNLPNATKNTKVKEVICREFSEVKV